MTRTWRLWLSPIIVLAVLSGVWLSLVKPMLEGLLKNQVSEQTENNEYFHVETRKVDLSLLPPRIEAHAVALIPKGQLQKIFSPAQLENFSLEINPFKLLIGKIEVNRISAKAITLAFDLDSILQDDSPPRPLPVKQIFEALEKFPVRNLEIDELNLQVSANSLDLSLGFENSGISLNYSKNSIKGELHLPKVHWQWQQVAGASSLQGSFGLDERNLSIQSLQLREKLLQLEIDGLIPDWAQLPVKPELQLNMKASGQLSWLDQLLTQGIPMESLKMQGLLQTQVKASLKNKRFSFEGETAFENFTLSDFALGSGKGGIQGTTEKIELKNFSLFHPAGKAQLPNFSLSLDKSLDFSGKAEVESLDIQKLLNNLNLKEVPVWLMLAGQLDCKGQFTTPYKTSCQANLSGKNLEVKAGIKSNDSKIVEIPNLAAKGEVTIDNKGVGYKSQVKFGSDSGSSEGFIDYKEGFSISFKTPQLQLKNVTYLSGLDLKGSTAIEGKTEGDSQSAIFEMKLSTKEFSLDGFDLGNVTTDLSYQSGVLYFEDVLGAYRKTQFLGGLQVDLNKERISGRLSAPVLAIEDIFSVLKNLFTVPVQLTGLGQGEIEFFGPFDFWKLDFKLKTFLKNTQIGTEVFDQLELESRAQNGVIQIDKAILSRNKTSINASGSIGPDQALKLDLRTDNLRVEEMTFMSKLNSSLFGILKAQAAIRGKLEAPQLQLNANIDNTVFGEQELQPSKIEMNLTKKQLELKMNLLGERIVGAILFPFKGNQSPLSIKIQANDWKYGHLISLLTGAELPKDFETRSSGSLQLESPQGDIFESTGQLRINDLYIYKSGQSMKNPEPIVVNFQQGVASIQSFKMRGPGNDITLEGGSFTVDRLQLRLLANADLKFFHIVLPFLDDINGPASVSAAIGGSLFKPEIFGSAELKNTFIRLKGFPHAFEKIRSDISFSQNRVLINSLKGQIAGGTLDGDGSISILGLKNFPVNLRARIEGVTLNVPDKVKTQGNGDLVFTGRWFPFVLSGTYRVNNALIEKEFTENTSSTGIRQSIYLPKVLREETFEPITLDLQVIAEKGLHIKNSMMDGYAAGNIQVKGTPTNPILLGKVGIQKDTKLMIKDKIFEIQTGTVEFDNPQEVNPNLFITAQSRINEYDVSVLVQGLSKNPSIRLSSIPQLNEQDIISLLALGVTSSQLDQNIQSKDQQTQTGYEIWSAIVANNPLSKNIQERFGVNVQFTSSYDSTKNIAVPKVTLSRKLSDRLNVAASQTLGDQTTYDVKLQLLFTKNFSAVGTWEGREVSQVGDNLSDTTINQNQSIFGLDLEYKTEFK